LIIIIIIDKIRIEAKKEGTVKVPSGDPILFRFKRFAICFCRAVGLLDLVVGNEDG
jgi:hypothetical protein